MRGVRPLVASALLVGACVGACSSFEGSPEAPDDGGAVDGAVVDAPNGGDVTQIDADGAADAGADAAPAGMVLVALGKTKFWIDREEVTAAAFSSFVGVDAGFAGIAGCTSKNGVGMGPFPGCLSGTVAPDEPIRCVDWCDAVAYCMFRGKRLCGKVGGGSNTVSDESNAGKSEWVQACAGSNLAADRFPYGDGSVDQDACNTDHAGLNKPVSVGQYPNCIGATPDLHDMSGNVEEWVDSCSGTGANDNCVVHGGGYNEQPRMCSHASTFPRGSYAPYRGFRCCKDF